MSILKSASIAADQGSDEDEGPKQAKEDSVCNQRSSGFLRCILVGYYFSWVELGSDCICLSGVLVTVCCKCYAFYY
jgi:hypothetical protein